MAKGFHTPEHVRGVAAILAEFPDAATTGFPTVMRALRDELGCEDDPPEISFIPDAFRLNRATQEIEIYEVEVTHGVSLQKLHALGYYWGQWDAEGDHDWLPVLITVNRFGHQRRFDLCIAYHDMLARNRPAPIARLQGESA